MDIYTVPEVEAPYCAPEFFVAVEGDKKAFVVVFDGGFITVPFKKTKKGVWARPQIEAIQKALREGVKGKFDYDGKKMGRNFDPGGKVIR